MAFISLSSTGIQNWFIQRLTAFCLTVYVIGLFGYIAHSHITNQVISFARWQGLFSTTWMQWATMIAFLSISFHAYLGLIIIIDDYIHNTVLRLIMVSALLLIIFSYFMWSISILWQI